MTTKELNRIKNALNHQHQEYDHWIHRNDYTNFEKQQQNDRTKDQWCHDNGIQMIRITKIKDIPILLNFLSIEK